ncbi:MULTISPECIES: hypothetical protein [Betaproteobacteria]|uniref:hypothetical protein n=1 Tax=Betaproteobacteria TaxID=28216 RepID=UPI003A8A6692
MTALDKDRATAQRAGDLVADPLAADALIYAGGMYVLAAGLAVSAAGASGGVVRAVARVRADAANGDAVVQGKLGVFRFANDGDAIARQDIGADAFAVDDQTVALSGAVKAGVVVDIDDAGVWVRIG